MLSEDDDRRVVHEGMLVHAYMKFLMTGRAQREIFCIQRISCVRLTGFYYLLKARSIVVVLSDLIDRGSTPMEVRMAVCHTAREGLESFSVMSEFGESTLK